MTRGSQAGLASPVGLRSNADQIRRMWPLGSPKREGGVTTNEAKCPGRNVVGLIHSTAELMPASIRRGTLRGVCGRPGRGGFHTTADRASRSSFERVSQSARGGASATALAATSRASRPPSASSFLHDIPVIPGSLS